MANNEKTPVQIPEWADNGAITTPTASQVQAGWIQGQRPFHFTMNWIQNIYAQKINYILARGIVDWVASNPYEQYALINYEGVIYKKKSAGTTTSSTTPDTDTTNWERNTPVFDVNPTPDTGALRTASGGLNVNGLDSTDDVTVEGNVIADNIPFLPWSNTVTYPIASLVKGSDNLFYYANQSSSNVDPVSDTTDSWRQYPCKKTYTNSYNVVEYFDGRVEIALVGDASDNNGKSNIVFPLNIELKDEFYFPQVSEISATVSAIAKMGVAFGTKTKTGFGVWVSDEDGTPRAGENPYIYVSYSK